MSVFSANRPARSRNAYVTLLTNDPYLPGAEALVRSLRLSGTQADIVILHTEGVASAKLATLEDLGARLIQTSLLDVSEEFRTTHRRDNLHGVAPFTKGRKPDFHTPLANFCKLRLWQLTEYERIVFLDADALVIQNIDVLFGYPEFSAAPNVYESLSDFHRLNSGVFVAQPSEATFEAMLAALDQPGIFWKRTDQTFLQSYFPDWHGLPIFFNLLQYVWFNLPELWDWNSVKVIHYQYEKPWESDHDRSDLLRPLTDLWRRVYAGEGLPDLGNLPQPGSQA